MSETMKMRAVFTHVRQIGPYDYESRPRVLDLNPATTIAEIVAWHDETDPADHTPVIQLIVDR